MAIDKTSGYCKLSADSLQFKETPMPPVDVGAHLKVAEEQLRLARDLVTDPEACVRMDVPSWYLL